MIIETFVLGDFQTNSYCLRSDENSKECIVIDTGIEDTDIVRVYEEKQFTPLVLIVTHGHFDHIAGLNAMREKFPDMKVYMHKLDSAALEDPNVSFACLTGDTFTAKPADLFLEDGDVIEQAGIKLQVIHTPGHTPGGIGLYSEEDGVLFAGDTLFAESVGRTDFPGGNSSQIIESIKEKLLPLPDDTKVYPGHGPATTIGHEKQYNPFLR